MANDFNDYDCIPISPKPAKLRNVMPRQMLNDAIDMILAWEDSHEMAFELAERLFLLFNRQPSE